VKRPYGLDCDVIQADGGTRTASITGAYVALVEALWNMKKKGVIQKIPLRDSVGAIRWALLMESRCLICPMKRITALKWI